MQPQQQRPPRKPCTEHDALPIVCDREHTTLDPIIRSREDESVKDVRDDLLRHRGRFAGDWIEVRSERNRLSRHIRYDQIVDVTAPFGDDPQE
jgi:hypothetical protein